MAAPPTAERTRRRAAGDGDALARAWSRALIWLTSPHSPAAGILPASFGPFLTVRRISRVVLRPSVLAPSGRGLQAILAITTSAKSSIAARLAAIDPW